MYLRNVLLIFKLNLYLGSFMQDRSGKEFRPSIRLHYLADCIYIYIVYAPQIFSSTELRLTIVRLNYLHYQFFESRFYLGKNWIFNYLWKPAWEYIFDIDVYICTYENIMYYKNTICQSINLIGEFWKKCCEIKSLIQLCWLILDNGFNI